MTPLSPFLRRPAGKAFQARARDAVKPRRPKTQDAASPFRTAGLESDAKSLIPIVDPTGGK
jgi:hypothetical protein